MRHMPGTTLLRFDDELLRTLMTRDENCNLLTLEVGEPDAEGVCNATVTVHYEDNPLEFERKVSAKLADVCAAEAGTDDPEVAAEWLAKWGVTDKAEAWLIWARAEVSK